MRTAVASKSLVLLYPHSYPSAGKVMNALAQDFTTRDLVTKNTQVLIPVCSNQDHLTLPCTHIMWS